MASGVSFLTTFVDGDGVSCVGPALFLRSSDWDIARRVLAELKTHQIVPKSTRLDGVYISEHEAHFDRLELNPGWVRKEVPHEEFPLSFSKN
jgi:hypothetical protein